ncbi:MAG: REP-associated tyrosine transposase [Agriterribacter sp.]
MNYEFTDGYKIRDQFGLFFMTFTVVDWIDLFSRQLYRDILIKNMKHCQLNKRLSVGAYVIMMNHMHVIWQSKSGNLSGILRDYKSFCTKELIAAIENNPESRKEWLLRAFAFHAGGTNQNKDYKLWTNNNHPEQIYTEKFMRTKLDYIHDNPVRAGWVEKPEDYLYSSASNYILGKGIMEIDYLY